MNAVSEGQCLFILLSMATCGLRGVADGDVSGRIDEKSFSIVDNLYTEKERPRETLVVCCVKLCVYCVQTLMKD